MGRMITQLLYDCHNQIKDAEKWESTVISRLCSRLLNNNLKKTDGAGFANQLNDLNLASFNWWK